MSTYHVTLDENPGPLTLEIDAYAVQAKSEAEACAKVAKLFTDALESAEDKFSELELGITLRRPHRNNGLVRLSPLDFDACDLDELEGES